MNYSINHILKLSENNILNHKAEKILDCLSLNARISYSEISKKLDLSRQVVKYQQDMLEEKKIIEGHYAIFNIFKLGFLYHRISDNHSYLPVTVKSSGY